MKTAAARAFLWLAATLAVVAMATTVRPMVHAQQPDESGPPLADLSITSEQAERSNPTQNWKITVRNNPVAGFPGTTAAIVKVGVSINNGIDDAAMEEVHTIRDLPTGRSVDLFIPFPTVASCGSSLAVSRIDAKIIETDPLEPPGLRFNNTTENEGLSCPGTRFTNGDAGVRVDISDRSPQPGGTTTFTVKAENVPGDNFTNQPRSDQNDIQFDVRVKISLSSGLNFGTTTAPDGTTFSETTGNWEVRTLTDPVRDNARSTKSLPVMVNLTNDTLIDIPWEKRCLTAEVVIAKPEFAWDGSKRLNDTYTACLGEKPPLRLHQGNINLFHYLDCVGVTTTPCTSADTLELVARAPTGSTAPDIGTSQPDELLVHISGPEGRHGSSRSAFQGTIWSTGTATGHPSSAPQVEGVGVNFQFVRSGWSAYRWTISDVSPKQRPGALKIIHSTRYRVLLDADATKSAGPFNLGSSTTRNEYPVFVTFGALGTYTIELTVGATKSSTAYTDTGTYTFHVGPTADLEVRDAGASPTVAAGRRGYTVMALNNGPDTAPAVQVTLSGVPEGAEAVLSHGSYSQGTCVSGLCAGVWNIGELGRGDQRASGHANEHPTLTVITDATTPADITATIENTQEYSVCIDSSGDDVALNTPSETACTATSGNTWHTAKYYDHVARNDSATITARAGSGDGRPDAPGGVAVTETPVGNIVQWQPVETVNEHEVTHYEVQRSASPWMTLPKVVADPMYVDMDLRPGQAMQYRVRAVNIFGVGGPWSAPTLTGPDAPGDFTAEIQGGEVWLTWTKPDGNGADITGYAIQVSNNAGGTWSDTGAQLGPGDTVWVHRALPVGPTLLYRIRASTVHGYGPWAQATFAASDAPHLTAIYDGASEVVLSWTMPGGSAVPVQSWELQHSPGGVNWSRLATVRAEDGRTYTHGGRSPGATGYYRVRAVTALGHGPWSEPVMATTAAGPPGNFRAEANGPSEIVLTWTKPVGDVQVWEYEVQRKTEGITWVRLATVYPEDGTSYVDDNLSPGGTWSYRVRAVSIAGGNLLAGDWSAEASATTDSGGPEAPKDPAAVADGENATKLSWTEPEDNGSPITGYRVEHSTDGGGTWALLRARHSGTAYSHTGLPSGTTHHYRVAAINRNGRSPFSYVVSATTTGTETTVPGMPADLRVTGVDRNRVSIAWGPPAVDGGTRVTGYEYRYLGPCAADPADLCQSGAVRAGGTSVSIGGLNVAGTYDFMVRAINAVGAGEWSDPVQAEIAPEARGKVVVTPASLTVTEAGSATYRVKLSHEPARPIQLGLFWEDPDNDLSLALAGYQGMLLLPSNYAPPEGAMWDGWAYRWNVGIPITVEAEEDDDAEDGAVVIHHDVWTAPADLLGNPPDWAEDPVYHFMTGPAVKVTVRDND